MIKTPQILILYFFPIIFWKGIFPKRTIAISHGILNFDIRLIYTCVAIVSSCSVVGLYTLLFLVSSLISL